MKKIILLVAMMVPYAALGVEPSKVCPSGFVVVQEDAMTITTYAFPVLYDVSFPGTEQESKTDQHGIFVIEFERK